MRTDGGFDSLLRKIWAIAQKDLHTELRTREVFGAMTAFSVLAVILFGLAFDLVPRQELIAPGVLWGMLLFSGILGLNRSFGAEVDQQSLSALLLAPMDRSAIYFGKVLANLCFMLVTQVFVVPVLFILFGVNLFRLWIFAGLFLGLIGYVSIGTFFAALSSSIRARETLLPILMLPVLVPLFLAGLSLTSDILVGRTFTEVCHWLGMLILYDLTFLIIPYMVFDLIWEEG